MSVETTDSDYKQLIRYPEFVSLRKRIAFSPLKRVLKKTRETERERAKAGKIPGPLPSIYKEDIIKPSKLDF